MNTTFAEPISTSALLQTNTNLVYRYNITVDANLPIDAVSADLMTVKNDLEMYEIAGSAVGKIVLLTFIYPSLNTTQRSPDYFFHIDRLSPVFLFERPPQYI